ADVPDVHVVAGGGANLLRIGAADEDTAVRVGVGVELCAQLEVAVRLLRHQETGLALVRDDRTAFGMPVGIADRIEILRTLLPVHQRLPARSWNAHLRARRQRNDDRSHSEAMT